ncbi:hypothetical protein HYC85_012718 [Camellia sinensis]|uniref:Cellulose synthase n=1 Tax=Camellia sinensis TaxID=4442 RepID=A0A7J7HDL6_CAMSI|nr:hypothetical protein HYC85_012718 [Camellia sinensis]
MATTTHTLHTCKVEQTRATINKLHMLFHFTAILSLLYYRISYLFHHAHEIPIFSWCLVTTSELMFTSIWIITQAFRWWPVTRTIHPENLCGNTELPGIDVFICTADPKKEPTVEVMNTVLSAVVLDYPLEKLAMYLSDDDGWPLTLYGLKEACLFGRSWIPFCRKYGIKTPSPERYFSSFGDDDRVLRNHEFMAEEEDIKVD